MSHSFFTATAVCILGAGSSLSHLSEFPGPPHKTLVDCGFMNLFLNSHVAKQYGNRVKTDGVNQSNINGEKLINYPFPYCSLGEQKQIVAILDERLSEIDRTERDIQSQLQKAESLRQSILKQAFSGKLVAQDPDDEPATELLKRIKNEKVGPETNAKVAK
ncbi:MAG: restriction endonuclease subunit S [SAR202 cluster bacterium]|nr:restriction endonuclease subunit S [SAR202 cluster bacterium]